MGKTLKFDISSQFWGKFEGIWGNPGEIPHIGWKIWSKRLKYKYLKKNISKIDAKEPSKLSFSVVVGEIGRTPISWVTEKCQQRPPCTNLQIFQLLVHQFSSCF